MNRQAQTFNQWMEENAKRLMAILSVGVALDMDVFQDTYLSLAVRYRRVGYDETFIKAFIETYRKFNRIALRENLNTIRPDDLFFSLLQSTEDTETAELRRKESRFCLAEAIAEHIRATYDVTEVTIWGMHMERQSIRDIADAIGVTIVSVNKTLHKIKENTNKQFAYAI